MSAKQVSEALGTVPYGLSLGKTVISILWEKSADEPPPVPPEAPADGGTGQPRRPAPGELVAHPAPIPAIAITAGSGRVSSGGGLAAVPDMELPDQPGPSVMGGAPDGEAPAPAPAGDVHGQPESPEAGEAESGGTAASAHAAEAVETLSAEPPAPELSEDRSKPRLGAAPMAPRLPRAPAMPRTEISMEAHPESEADPVPNGGGADEAVSKGAEAGAETSAVRNDAALPDAQQPPAARARKPKAKRAKREARTRDPQAT
jgi:hypothetical protein